MQLLGVLMVIGGVVGTLAMLTSYAVPDCRRSALKVAGSGFFVAGWLGAMSGGIVFLFAAMYCGAQWAQSYPQLHANR